MSLRIDARRRRDWCLWLTAVLALASLPGAIFDPVWILAFTAPALLLYSLRTRRGVRLWQALLATGVVQVSCVVLAQTVVPLTQLAGLVGCTLLPPLAFLAARRGRSDVLHTLFLSFCLFLIGTILGEPSGLQCIAFLCLATLTLQLDVASAAAQSRHCWRAEAGGDAGGTRSLTAVTVAVVATCLCCFQLLRVLPSPDIEAKEPPGRRSASSRSAQVGLSSRFEFGTATDGPLNMRADELVQVRATDGGRVPHDLYLRCSHFDLPGLDRWQTARPRDRRRVRLDRWQSKTPYEHAGFQRLSITIVEPSSDFLFVPAGTFRISGAPDLSAVPEPLRVPAEPAPGTTYQVAFQDLRSVSLDAMPDPQMQRFATVSPDLLRWRGMFDDVAQQPSVEREMMPGPRALAIAAELQRRCGYSLEEPKGPHGHSILNFLDGNRQGFCMHFASVTAVCLRLAKIPCRIGVGLYGGEPIEGDRAARTYGSQHAHAWVEIPLEELGWVVFDPTPAIELGRRRWPYPSDLQLDETTIGAAGDADAASTGSGRTFDLLARPALHPGFWLVLVLVGVGATFLRRKRAPRAEVRQAVPKPAVTARRLLDKILLLLAKAGRPRRRGEGLERFGASLDDVPQLAELPLEVVRDAISAYQETRFGDRPFDRERRERMAGALRLLVAAKPRPAGDRS